MFTVNELLKATRGTLISQAKNPVIKGISIDSRTIKNNEAFIAIKGNNFDGHNFIDEAIKKGSSCIIKEARPETLKPKNTAFIEVKDTQKALGDIARIHRNKFDIPVIAITGSNGKTTAKEMVARILSTRYNVLKNEGTKNNQIGLPLTLLNLKPSHNIVVLEIGTNHFGEVKTLSEIAQPNIGIITNIGPAHLEYLGNLRGIFREKIALIKNLKKPKIAILNADDDLLKIEVAKKIKSPLILGFGIKKRSDFFATDIKNQNGKVKFLLKKYKFTLRALGYHNIYNALIAIAVGRLFGIEYKEIALRLSGFDFPRNRLKFRQLNKIRFIDDTYNSNPASLKQALDALANFKNKGRKILVMGDMLELGEKEEFFHCQAGRRIGRVCDTFVAVGKLSQLAGRVARAYGLDARNIFNCESSRQARDVLFNKISPNEDDVILVKGSRLMRMEYVI
jgi:UDP-N-acetylmuramoyl-tripeptide--D-alanyl-D-alanine ligase